MRRKSHFKRKRDSAPSIGAELALLLRSRFSEKKKNEKKYSRKQKHSKKRRESYEVL